MSDLVPPLELEKVTSKRKVGRPRRNKSVRGRTYSVYIAPQEATLLEYLGRKQGGKGISEGIHYLVKFFGEHMAKTQD